MGSKILNLIPARKLMIAAFVGLAIAAFAHFSVPTPVTEAATLSQDVEATNGGVTLAITHNSGKVRPIRGAREDTLITVPAKSVVQ